MKSWNAPEIPTLPGTGKRPVLFDSMSRSAVATPKRSGTASLYVCGITPYDATHLGHAATYVAYDLLGRLWRDAGIEVSYVQNVTDIDDPLLERATATGIDWRDLAEDQTALFRSDMEALRVIPPDHYIGAVESIPAIAEAVRELVDAGAAYVLESGDVYQDLSRRSKPAFGALSEMSRNRMLELFAQRGGDPEVEGKKDALDPLLWRSAREGEPSWPGGSLGPGRPGWHIECVVIARDHLGLPITVQAGGEDLIFPHHEMGSQHACALTSGPLAKRFSHSGMVGYEGEKMSKSKGNLVLVSRLRESGIDPRAIRLVLLGHHYRCDWEFTEDMIDQAAERLAAWELAISRGRPGRRVVRALRGCLADDLDAPAALKLLDAWAASREDDEEAQDSAEEIAQAVDALLGVRLERAQPEA